MSTPVDDDTYLMLKRFRTSRGASHVAIREVEQSLGLTFPDDYSALLQWSNEGEGPVGESGYLQLWPVEQIELMNDQYSVHRFLPKAIAIGTDLGGNAYLIDFSEPPRFACVEFSNLDYDDMLWLGSTVIEFVHAIGR